MPITDTDIAQILRKAFKSKLPQWRQDYVKRIARDLQVHTNGNIFTKVDTLFPNESPDSKAHCVNTYEPITKGSIWKGINNIIRIFSNSSFSVTASDETLDFINKSNFGRSNLFNFFLEDWVKNAVACDPNGYYAVYPEEYIEDKGGERIRFVKSEHLRKISDEMVVFISEEESDKDLSVVDSIIGRVTYFDKTVGNINSRQITEKTYNQVIEVKVTKPVWHVFTKEYLLRFTATNDDSFDYELFFYKQPVGMIPCFHAGGVHLQHEIYESFVDPFISFGNLSLLQHRNHRAVDLMFSYPRMSEIQVPCPNPECHEGMITDLEKKETTCSVCSGSGMKSIQSPYKVYQKKLETGLTDPELMKAILATPPVDFHTPDVSILNYSKESWKDYLRMAEEAIFIQQKQQTGNVESAKAKEIDLDSLYAFLQRISKVFYEKQRCLIQTFENYEQRNPVEVSVEMPISFAILTEAEAFEALNEILGNDTPVFVKAQQVENFVKRFVGKSSPVVKAMRILKKIDPLLFYSNKDVQTFKSNNAIKSDTWTTHIYAYPVLMQLYDADKQLFDKKDDAIIKSMNAELEKLRPTSEGTSLKDQILGNTGNPLAESVGGLTGMIEIAKAVASGLYDLDAAVALVASRFNISEDEARRQIGSPNVSETQVEKVVQLT